MHPDPNVGPVWGIPLKALQKSGYIWVTKIPQLLAIYALEVFGLLSKEPQQRPRLEALILGEVQVGKA